MCVQSEMLNHLGSRYQNPSDPYEEEYSQKYSLIRDPKLITQSGPLWTFDNYRAGILGEGLEEERSAVWTSALVDLTKLKKVFWCLGQFRDSKVLKLGHLFSVASFGPGGVITPSGETNTLAISYEAMRGKGVEYSLWSGINGCYSTSFVLGSFKDMLQKADLAYSQLEIMELALSEEQIKKFLIYALNAAMDPQAPEIKPYHTVNNSCITKQFDLLNHVLSPQKQIRSWFSISECRVMRTPVTFWPGLVKTSLEKGSLLRETQSLPMPINGPGTKASLIQ